MANFTKIQNLPKSHMTWTVEKIELDLKFLFKISRSASICKTNFILTFSDGFTQGVGECAPNIRYGESIELTQHQLEQFVNKGFTFESIPQLKAFLKSSSLFQSVKNGIETCFLDYYCNKHAMQIHELFQIPQPIAKATMFTIPILQATDIIDFYKQFDLEQFTQIKIKIDDTIGTENLLELKKIAPHKQLFVDANEAFGSLESYLDFERSIANLGVVFMEQPFPAAAIDLYKKLKPISKIPIFGDESIIAEVDIDAVKNQFHGINVKMMKTGGFLEALSLLQKARKVGLKTMIGCMVETSLGIHHAFKLSGLADYLDLDSFVYIQGEPYHLIQIENGKIGKF